LGCWGVGALGYGRSGSRRVRLANWFAAKLLAWRKEFSERFWATGAGPCGKNREIPFKIWGLDELVGAVMKQGSPGALEAVSTPTRLPWRLGTYTNSDSQSRTGLLPKADLRATKQIYGRPTLPGGTQKKCKFIHTSDEIAPLTEPIRKPN
jgi:hypothetical protein